MGESRGRKPVTWRVVSAFDLPFSRNVRKSVVVEFTNAHTRIDTSSESNLDPSCVDGMGNGLGSGILSHGDVSLPGPPAGSVRGGYGAYGRSGDATEAAGEPVGGVVGGTCRPLPGGAARGLSIKLGWSAGLRVSLRYTDPPVLLGGTRTAVVGWGTTGWFSRMTANSFFLRGLSMLSA
jgi:hypothetical protein